MEMRQKNLLVFFLAIASVLTLVATVSAADFSIDKVTVDGIDASNNDVSVTAGESITVKVYFTSEVNESDIRVKAEIEGDKLDVDARTSSFDVEDGKRYRKVLTLKVPYELKDEISGDISLNLKIWGGESDAFTDSYTLRVQRPTYNADIKSVSVSQTVEAGDSFPVDIVLKNIGYNDLDDVYVTARLPALGVEKSSYFGDLVALECDEDKDSVYNYGVDVDRKCDEDDTDTATGRLYLKVPYNAEDGVYALEIEMKNDDMKTSEVREIVVKNDFVSNVVVTEYRKTVAPGENAEYALLVVNPTNKLKVYRVVPESSGGLSVSADESVVAVPAGSSKTLRVIASADSEGEYSFDVNVFSGEELVDTVTLEANAEGTSAATAASPIVVLTVILAIIFIVLLVVLIVLIGKKPEKSEELGESYY